MQEVNTLAEYSQKYGKNVITDRALGWYFVSDGQGFIGGAFNKRHGEKVRVRAGISTAT
jgi:hypothetical protein